MTQGMSTGSGHAATVMAVLVALESTGAELLADAIAEAREAGLLDRATSGVQVLAIGNAFDGLSLYGPIEGHEVGEVDWSSYDVDWNVVALHPLAAFFGEEG